MQNVLTVEQLNSMSAQIEAHKLALVSREESRGYLEERKERFIAKHQEEWKAMGSHYRSLRVACGLSQEQVADAIGVSTSKVSNFENGRSITHAKLVAKAYEMFLAIHKEVCDLENIHDYAGNVIENVELFVKNCQPEEQPTTLHAIKCLSDYLFEMQIRLAQQKPKAKLRLQGKVMETEITKDPVYRNLMKQMGYQH